MGASEQEEIDKIAHAFMAVPLNKTEASLIQVLLDNPSSTIADLTSKMGWSGQSWNLRFGKICKRRMEHLPEPATSYRAGGKDKPYYGGVIATFDEKERLLTMKPVAAKAFSLLGIKSKQSSKQTTTT